VTIVLAGEGLGRVADLMTEIVCVLDESSTVADARDALAGAEITGAPVMRDERVVGVVSQRDLLIAEEDQRVAEVMTEIVYAVRPEDPVTLAVKLMVDQQIHRAIVVNDEGQLQGVLTAMDVLAAIASRMQSDGPLRFTELADGDD
jgi:CBS domain-containing membrane protein/CBS domain-containing protein